MKVNRKNIKFSLVFLGFLSSLFLVFPTQLAYAGVPTVVSAKITGINTIVIVYSEAVITVALEYSDLQLTAGGPRNITLLLGSGTDTITLTFDGAAAAADETATIDVAGPISFASGDPLVPLNDYPITDGQVPSAPNLPTAAAGPIIDAAEEAAGFNVIAPLGISNAVAGDSLVLLLGGFNFPIPLTRVLTVGDIGAGQYTFNVASGQLGADGLKSITSRVTDTSNNVGPQSPPLLLTLSAGIAPLKSNSSHERISQLYRTVYPQQITFSQDKDVTLNGKKHSFDTKMETKLIKVNEPLDLKISFPNNLAFSNIHKIQLFLDVNEKIHSNKKDVLIVYDKFSGLDTIDKKKYLSDTSFEINSNKDSIDIIFHLTFQKQMDKADFSLQYIDLVRNSRTIKIPKALEVVELLPTDLQIEAKKIISDSESVSEINRYDFIISENSKNGLDTLDLLDNENTEIIQKDKSLQWYELMRFKTIQNDDSDYVKNVNGIIPSGIKEQFYWWANEKISDYQFLKSIKYLENQGFLVMPDNIKLNTVREIPDWVNSDNGWWDNLEIISDNEFISTLENIFE